MLQCPETCHDCPLGAERDLAKGKIVWGQIPEHAELLIVGEAPGHEESRLGEPFVGRAGKMLDEMFISAGINRRDVAILNVVKCRPPENRSPTKAEIKACSKYLNAQIREIKPKLIMTMGNVSTQAIVGVGGVTRIRGSLRKVSIGGEDFLVMPSLHPSFVMRSMITAKSGARTGPYADVVSDLRKAVKVLRGEVELGKQHEYYLADTVEKVVQLSQYLCNVNVFAFDTETTGLDPYTSKVIGVSFSAEAYSAYYVPMYVPDELSGGVRSFWASEELAKVVSELSAVFTCPARKICHSARFDVMMVYTNWGCKVVNLWFDTKIAAFLLDENVSTALEDLAGRRYVDLVGYKETAQKAAVGKRMEGFANVPLAVLWPYGCADADATYRLYVDFSDILARNVGLSNMMYNVCMSVCSTLIKMEQRGMLVDMSHVTSLRRYYEEKYRETVQQISVAVGHDVNPKSVDSVGVLLDELNVPVPRSPKTGKAKTDVSSLEEYVKDFPVLAKVVEARQIAKNISAYVEGIAGFVKDDFCVHPQFTQTEAVTGRLSCRQPNMQNIKKEKPIQNLFVARPGFKLLYADYVQMELRFVSWMAQDEGMFQGWREGLDFHRYSAAAIFRVPIDQVTDAQRQVGKSVNFAITYGSSPAGLAFNLGVDVEEGRRFVNRYFERFPALKIWLEETIQHCRDFGYVVSPYGRVRRIPDINSSDKRIREHAEHQAVNSPVQGGASDFCCVNMSRLQDVFECEGEEAHVLVQVHDAIIAEVPVQGVEKYKGIAREVLVQPVLPVDVPMAVELVSVDRWGEVK